MNTLPGRAARTMPGEPKVYGTCHAPTLRRQADEFLNPQRVGPKTRPDSNIMAQTHG